MEEVEKVVDEPTIKSCLKTEEEPTKSPRDILLEDVKDINEGYMEVGFE